MRTDPSAARYSSAPAISGTRGNLAFSVRNRPSSQSGFTPRDARRNSLNMSRSPYTTEVLLCSVRLTVAGSRSVPRSARNRAVGTPRISERWVRTRVLEPTRVSSFSVKPGEYIASYSTPSAAPSAPGRMRR